MNDSGNRYFCSIHPHHHADYYCVQCDRLYCQGCVSASSTGTTSCPTCGTACVAPSGIRFINTWWQSLVKAFRFPLTGKNVLVLAIVLFFAVFLQNNPHNIWVVRLRFFGGVLLLAYAMQSIFAGFENRFDALSFPDYWDRNTVFFQVLGLTLISLAPVLLYHYLFHGSNPVILYGLFGLSFLYYPIALAGVACEGTIFAALPTEVLSLILAAPLYYLITLIFLAGIVALGWFGREYVLTHSTHWVPTTLYLVTFYLIFVATHFLGAAYGRMKNQAK